MTAPRVGSFHPSPDATKAIDGLRRAVKRAEGIGLLVGPTGSREPLLLCVANLKSWNDGFKSKVSLLLKPLFRLF